MKASLELLFHYRCDRCQKWWSVADIRPVAGATVRCPHCGDRNTVDGMINGKQEEIQWLSDRASWDFGVLTDD